MSRYFTAAILEEVGKPLVLRKLRATQPGIGQVGVQVHYSGICGKNLNEQSGKAGPDPYIPHCMGHEGGGIVETTGPGVTKVKPGDHVVLHWRPASGIESEFPAYFCEERDTEHPGRNAWYRYVDGRDESVIGRVGAGRVTTFQEYSVVSENRVTKVPDNTDLRVAALLGCAVTTGLGVVLNEANIRPGQSVIVLGCGGVGLNVIQGCSLINARPVTGMDLSDTKLSLATRFGATAFVNNSGMDASEAREALLDTTGPADFVIDTIGHPAILDLAFEVCAPQGTVVLVGQMRQAHRVSLATEPMHAGKKLICSFGGAANPDTDIPRYLKLQDAGLLDIPGLVTRSGPLREVNTIMDEIRAARAGRTLLDMVNA